MTGEPSPKNRLPFRGWSPLIGGVLAGIVLRLIYSGKAGDAYAPMMQSFILASPVLVAVVTVYIAETKARRTWSYYFLMPALANILFVVGTLLILIEGWICAILIVRCSLWSADSRGWRWDSSAGSPNGRAEPSSAAWPRCH